MKNLINALKQSVGLQNGKLLFGYEGNNYRELTWGALDDVVMGGVSESTFLIDPNGSENGGPTGLFKGVVSTANNGGFTSIRTKNLSTPEDLSAYDGIELRLKGDGRRYKLILRTSGDWDTVGYTAGFDTVKDHWQTVSITMVSQFLSGQIKVQFFSLIVSVFIFCLIYLGFFNCGKISCLVFLVCWFDCLFDRMYLHLRFYFDQS